MTYYGGKELAAAFRTVRNNTIKIAEEIPENKYEFKPAPDTRTVAQALAHVAASTGFQHFIHSTKVTDMRTVNFPELFQKFSADEQKPRALSRGYNERDARDQGIFIPDGHTLLERLLRR